MTDARKTVRAAAADLLERGQLPADEYAAVLAGIDDEDLVEATQRLAARLLRLPAAMVAGCLAGVLLQAAAGDALAASKQVLMLERIYQATARRSGG